MSMLGKPLNKTDSVELVQARRCIYITLGILSCLLNGVFLVALWKSWKIIKQKRISYHIANLAFSDALVGLFTLLYYITGDNKVGNVFIISAWATVLSSLLAICLMAGERTLAIIEPHRWRKIFPLKKVFLVMLVNWWGVLVLAILMCYYDLIMRFVFLVLYMTTIMITSLMYFYISFKMSKKRDVALLDSVLSQVQDKKIRLYQRKVGRFVLLLTTVLFLTVSPSFLTQTVKNYYSVSKLECDCMDTLTQLLYYFYMLEIINFVVNPVIYVWKMNLYREAMRRMFGKTGTALPVYNVHAER